MAAFDELDIYSRFEPMIPSIARSVCKSLPASFDTEDLEQTGRLALAMIARKYEPGREATFAAYARMRIRGAMISSVRGAMFHEASRERDAIRIDTAFSASLLDSDALSTARGFVPAQPAFEVRDPFLARAARRLPERQRKVIHLRYAENLTQKETGRRLGVSRSTAAREERDGLREIRSRLLLGKLAA